MERYIPVAKTRTKPPSVWLLFLSTGCHRAVQGTTILSNGKGHFGPTDRNDQKGQRGSPSKLVPNIPVEPNWNVRKFGLNGKPPHCKFWLSLCLIGIYFLWLTVGKAWWIPINLKWNMTFELVYATLLAKTRQSLRSPPFPAAIYTGGNLLALRGKQLSVFLVRCNLSNKMLELLLL